MIEILLIVMFSKKIAAMMTAKGRNPTGYVVLFVGLWFGGEIVGGIAGAVAVILMDPRGLDGDSFTCGAYILALIGAAIGGTIGYQIASAVSPIHRPRIPNFDDDDDEYGRDKDEPRRRRRRSEHDEGIEEDR